ncbi:MAG: stage III sporulation protein AB [Clostridia bacterium]|nr:stage III sporulation protein AB [Clostridia bacterium]
MLYLKFLNMILIIVICSYIGIDKSKAFSTRVFKLRNLKNSFNIFKTKLEFTYEPIKEIFTEISEIVYKNKNNIFKSYVENMRNGNFEDAWTLAVAENSFSLSKDDIKIISSFGNLLGKTDLKGQINEIELANNFLDKQIIEAEEIRKKNDKLYKSLGIIIGIAVVIVLV